jgi:hypothetical protein
MSAYIVSKYHIDLLVSACLHYGSTFEPSRGVAWLNSNPGEEFAGWTEVSNYRTEGDDYKRYVSPDALGQILVSENIESIRYRYPGDKPGEYPGPVDAYYEQPYRYEDPKRVLTPGEVFSAIDCLDYQSCEHPGWETSEAHRILDALRHSACRRVEGYESAPWGFERKTAEELV